MVHRRSVRHAGQAVVLLELGDLVEGVGVVLPGEGVEERAVDLLPAGGLVVRGRDLGRLESRHHLALLREVPREPLAVDHACQGHGGLCIGADVAPARECCGNPTGSDDRARRERGAGAL